MDITLQEVSSEEGEELATLRVEAMRESLERLGRFDPDRARQRFLGSFSPPDTRHILAGKVKVGFIVLRRGGEDWLLDHLYIHPEHQGAGIGSVALNLVLHEADRAAKPLRVGALKQSRSNDFYLRHGFLPTAQGEWDTYYLRLPRIKA